MLAKAVATGTSVALSSLFGSLDGQDYSLPRPPRPASTPQDATKALLAGADVVMMTSALLRNGPEHLREVEAGLRDWLASRRYHDLAQARGRLS